MVPLGNLLNRILAPGVLCALLISGCGSQAKHATTTTSASTSAPHHRRPTVWIYSSLPLHGRQRLQALQIQQGINLALSLAHHRVGRFRIRYTHLSDTAKPPPPPRRRGGPETPRVDASVGTTTTSRTSAAVRDATRTVRNAAQAARNPMTVAYIGDLDSSDTELSLPILNQAGILQISPGSGYPGLTAAYTYKNKINITQSGEPGKYYPQTIRTLLRLIPNDVLQAGAVLDVLHKSGCERFSAWDFGGTKEAGALLNAVIQSAAKFPSYKLAFYRPPPLSANTKSYVEYAHNVALAGVHCAVLVGRVTSDAAALTTELHEQLPVGSTIVGTSGLCDPGWPRAITASAPSSAVAKAVVANLYCMSAVLPLSQYSGSHQFTTSFRSAHHNAMPTAYTYYGYEAVRAVIRALREPTGDEDIRQQVLDSLSADIASADPGTWMFGGADEQYSTAYEEYDFRGGLPRPLRTITLPPYLPPSAG